MIKLGEMMKDLVRGQGPVRDSKEEKDDLVTKLLFDFVENEGKELHPSELKIATQEVHSRLKGFNLYELRLLTKERNDTQ